MPCYPIILNLPPPLFSLFASLPFLFLNPMSASEASGASACLPDASPVTNSTPLVSFLQVLQPVAREALNSSNFDPKFYVDLSLKPDVHLSQAERAFEELKSGGAPLSGRGLQDYVSKHFDAPGGDLEVAVPADFVPEPEMFLPEVENQEVRAWALQVHGLWKNLSRKVSGSVGESPEKHTLLPLPMPVVIPGSRFREVYYWDSFWVIRGLLASKMYETAKGIVFNLVYLLEKYGHVLNGARAYYTNRSQPPLLSAMIREIYDQTSDLEFVKKVLPALLKEHEFWTTGLHAVKIQDPQGCVHSLSRYYAMWNKPRPESTTIDVEFASRLSNGCEKQKFYREVASTAESGWDFSTRWMRNVSDMLTLATTSIIPVDLNVFILRMEIDIAFLAEVTGNQTLAQHFLEVSLVKKKAIDAVLWNEVKAQWLDYWLSNNTHSDPEIEIWKACNQNENVFASNFVPLWIKLFHSDLHLVDKVMKSLKSSGLIHIAGVASSLSNSGLQWDYPNGWGPYQHMLIEGLASSGLEEAKTLANDLSVRWIRTNHEAFKNTGAMHEKYDVTVFGGFGGGGEYVPQTGFGWSNGVILALLDDYGWPEDLELDRGLY